MKNNINAINHSYIKHLLFFLILSFGTSTVAKAMPIYRNPITTYLAEAEAGSQEAADNIRQCMTKNKGVKFDTDVFKSLMDYENEAGASADAQRCFIIGLCYSEGAGVPYNETTAWEWFTTAAEMGSPGAKFQIAGYEVKRYFGLSPFHDVAFQPNREDVEHGSKLIAELSKQGLATKYFNLGSLQKLDKKSRKIMMEQRPNIIWQALAAETGNVGACLTFINLYTGTPKLRDHIADAIHYADLLTDAELKDKGLILMKLDAASRRVNLNDDDLERLLNLYQRWCEKGNGEAAYLLGRCYEEGRRMELDYTKAASLYLAAAEKDVNPAQMRLAICYAQGLGVEQDSKLAKKWREKSAGEDRNVLEQVGYGLLCVGKTILAVASLPLIFLSSDEDLYGELLRGIVEAINP